MRHEIICSFFKGIFFIIFRFMLATGHPSKGIWKATGSVSLCAISDLDFLVEATILCGKFQMQFQKQILSTTTVRKIFVCFFNIDLVVTCGYKAPLFFIFHYTVNDKVNVYILLQQNSFSPAPTELDWCWTGRK